MVLSSSSFSPPFRPASQESSCDEGLAKDVTSRRSLLDIRSFQVISGHVLQCPPMFAVQYTLYIHTHTQIFLILTVLQHLTASYSIQLLTLEFQLVSTINLCEVLLCNCEGCDRSPNSAASTVGARSDATALEK